MEEEFKNLILLWAYAIMSICYCYYLPPRIKSGVFRLISVFPVCVLFLLLPMFSSSLLSSGITAFLFSALANLKLILLCFDQGPLFPVPSNLFRFICLTCFPVKVQQNPKSQNHLPKWVFPIKVVIFGLVLHVYDYKQNMHPIFLLGLYPIHLYLEQDILLALVKVVVTITLGCELEPQFNEPYLATSLQDFWGRRWNLMVSAVLRSCIYSPIRRICKGRMNSEWAMCIGVLVTFLISSLGHEIVSFYYTRQPPAWEVTLFFVLHGVCTVTEIAVKRRALGWRWKLRPSVSRLLTVGFLIVTSGWLFFPQLMRSGVMETRANDILRLIDFFKRNFLLLLVPLVYYHI